MLVKDYMTRHPIMIAPSASAAKAREIMAENKVRHLPVVGDGKRVLGLITRERLRIHPTDLGSLNVWEISRYLSELTAKDVMIKKEDLITTEQDVALEDAAKKMIDNKVGCLLVLDGEIVVGIITEIDMMIQLTDLLGGTVPGVRITIRMPNKIGETAKIITAVASQGWGIYGSGGHASPKLPGYWDTVLKIQGGTKEEVVAVLGEVESHEIIDVR